MSIQYPYENSREFAKNSDSRDPLRSYKEKFHFPRRPNGQRYIYFCGNSLGLQPITARGQVEKIMSDWEKLGVEGHFKAEEPWVPYHERLTPGMARVVGARHEEVVVMTDEPHVNEPDERAKTLTPLQLYALERKARTRGR